LIFLFKWQKEKTERPHETNPDEDLFFAAQVINNACATQALLSILLNHPEIDVGEELDTFRTFTKSFPPELKGEAIGSLDKVRNAHNSFARPEPFVPEEQRQATKDDDVFHFIAYIPHKGKIYELDGLKPGPIVLGTLNENEDWLNAVQPHIESRIQSYGSEIRFNLMAIIKDQRVVVKENKIKHTERVEELSQLSKVNDLKEEENAMECTPVHIDDDDGYQALLKESNPSRLRKQLEYENKCLVDSDVTMRQLEQKFHMWKNENIRRKHNYIPFVVSMLKILAKEKKLKPMMEKAFEKKQEREKLAKN